MNAIAAAVGIPKGKKMSIKNMATRLKRASKPAPPARDDGDHEYR
jgi:hypothetical protein